MTPENYRLAEAHLLDAKGAYTLACQAALRGDPDAPDQANKALAELREALAHLESLASAERAA